MNTRTDVALILWNTDILQLMSLVLVDRNLTSCGMEPGHGQETIEHLIVSCRPSVVIYDLEPPYARSTSVVLQLMERFPRPSFVLTGADPLLALKSAPSLSAFPAFQKPYEIDAIADTVSSLVARAAMDETTFVRTAIATDGRPSRLHAARRIPPPPAVRPIMTR